ncbi:MAG: methyltransferase domain-containing protein [Candidatus Tritonobacter lacicola]|nr:methyltransferase domain-containing protein [Candidatus Tritonobacter lacicola]
MTAPLNDAYRNFFRHLSDRDRYRVHTVHGFYVLKKGAPDRDRVNVVLRVDVDSCLHLTVPLAEEMKKLGLQASFYFLTNPGRHYRLWGSGVPGRVRELGHEVGLHTDHYYEQAAFGKDGLGELKGDIRKLSEEAGEEIKGMVYHGHVEIDRMGALNWDLYKDLSPAELGLAYHDGPDGPYATPGYPVWVPRCDCNLSDFMGIPDSQGWTYLPSWPVENLERLKPGDVCHVTIHTMKAFDYWVDWDGGFGERPMKRENTAVFILKKARIYFFFKLLPAIVRLVRRAFSASVLVLSYIVMYGGALFLRKRPGEEEPDTTLETEKEWMYGTSIDYWHGRLRDMGVLKKGAAVLEVGSGFGQWLIAFARDAGDAVGIEPDPGIRADSLDKIRESGLEERISILNAAAEHLPFPDGRFDTVLCLGVFQFTRQDQAMKEMARVLKPGGALALAANGIGTFLMHVANGVRFRSIEKTCYGLSGCMATVLKWLIGRDLGFTTAISVAEMKRRFGKAGLGMKSVRPWLSLETRPLKQFGLVVNYLFIAEKD